jgi:2-dehydro-3-deoxyphosphooctonate aldolase (KDO 8-P synthase)
MLFQSDKFLLIAGPCTLESESLCREVALALKDLQKRFPQLQLVFKGSFDKANRTSIHSHRGPGLAKGLEWLAAIKEEFGFPTLTDFHLPEQAKPVAEVVDILQIPAFLCRQTDMLTAAAATGRVVNVKKGQFLSPGEMRYVVQKLEESSASEIWLTERGTTFGYQNLVVDMRNFFQMAPFGHPMVFDATHSVQMPGAGEGSTTGKREFIPTLARAAVAAGANGLFVETHPDPEKATSDGPNQVPLQQMAELIEPVLKIRQALKG